MVCTSLYSGLCFPILFSSFFFTFQVHPQENSSIESLLNHAGNSLLAGDLQSARGMYEKALNLDHSSFEAKVGLGRIAMLEQDWAAAGKRFDEILRVDPRHVEANYGMGICKRELGKFRTFLIRRHYWEKIAGIL